VTQLMARVVGVSVWGPALEGWAASRPVLAGEMAYAPRDSPAPPPSILAPNERRRAGPVTRLALTVATEAVAMSGLPPDTLRNVFASANGDGVVVGSILTDLTRPDLAHTGGQVRLVSPTQFHNSVHNAAAGYWSIATANQQPTTCIACHDFTWAAALLTAMAEVVTHREAVLLCAYDHPMPTPLHAKRPLIAPFSVGLVLAPAEFSGGIAGITVCFVPEAPPTADDDAVSGALGQSALRALAEGNPAARSLWLLETMARGSTGAQALAYLDGRLDVTVVP
jgi:Beta-ketoacyl synthase, N-terminal domain